MQNLSPPVILHCVQDDRGTEILLFYFDTAVSDMRGSYYRFNASSSTTLASGRATRVPSPPSSIIVQMAY